MCGNTLNSDVKGEHGVLVCLGEALVPPVPALYKWCGGATAAKECRGGDGRSEVQGPPQLRLEL